MTFWETQRLRFMRTCYTDYFGHHWSYLRYLLSFPFIAPICCLSLSQPSSCDFPMTMRISKILFLAFSMWLLRRRATWLTTQPHAWKTPAKSAPCNSFLLDDCHGSCHSWGNQKAAGDVHLLDLGQGQDCKSGTEREAVWVPRSRGAIIPWEQNIRYQLL